MKTLDDFLKYHKFEQSHGLLAVEIRNGTDLIELCKLITPPLEPLTFEEIVEFFGCEQFAEDINQVRELTTTEDEAFSHVLRGAYPRTFYGSEPTLVTSFFVDMRRDRYLFFDFHSHPLGIVSIPSPRDLKAVNYITQETIENLESEKEFGYLPENFDTHGFRPIMGIGSFDEPFDNYTKEFNLDNYTKKFNLLLLQWKKYTKKTDFEGKIKKYEHIEEHGVLGMMSDYLKEFPYNLCKLKYRWNKKIKKYTLRKRELNKLKNFALKIVE